MFNNVHAKHVTMGRNVSPDSDIVVANIFVIQKATKEKKAKGKYSEHSDIIFCFIFSCPRVMNKLINGS